MKKAVIKKQASRSKNDWSKWSRYWKLLTECSRPSRNDLANVGFVIKQSLQNEKNPTIVILGATPEYRDLCFGYSLKYNAKVVCVELVKDMYLAMNELKYGDNPLESVVFCNWLNIDLPSDSVDIVLADLTDGNIEAEAKEKYLSEISRILKKNGKYITRHTVFQSAKKDNPLMNYIQIKKLVSDYEKQILEGRITIHQAGNFLGARLVWGSSYKSKTGKSTLSIYEEDLKKLKTDFAKDKLILEIIRVFDDVWGPMMNKYWEYYDLEKTKKYFGKFFKNIKYKYSKDYPVAHMSPIFEMSKK